MSALKRWILHPFIFGVYPIVALLAYNIDQIGPLAALRPLLLGLLLAGLLFLLFRPIFKDRYKAGLAATLSLILFFTYGHVHNLLHARASGMLTKNQTTGVLWALLFAAGMWLIARKIKDLAAWTRALNVIGILLLVFSLIQIAAAEVHTASLLGQQSAGSSRSIAVQLHPQPGKTPPDIYYIILDTYTRSDALQQAFGYDNSAFLTSLEQKGFFIASCSQSNYNSTEPSLTSSLNMNYLDQLSSKLSPPNTNISDLYPYLQYNAVTQTLKDLGYKIVAFESGFSPTDLRQADVFLSPQSDQSLQLLGSLTPFEAMLFRTSATDFIYETRFFPTELKNSLFDNAYLLHRDRILYELDKLAEVPALPGPKFVFVHILAPHNPFVFGPNGELLHRNTPFALNYDQDALQDYIPGYVGQVNYLDVRMLEVVDQILNNSVTPPVILLQGDHGSPRTPKWNMANLNVYYLPGVGKGNLYPSISPVNSFRVIFNAYFGGHLELLGDHACNNSNKDPYHCIVKTDPSPQCIKP
jgi:hypothetical protein